MHGDRGIKRSAATATRYTRRRSPRWWAAADLPTRPTPTQLMHRCPLRWMQQDGTVGLKVVPRSTEGPAKKRTGITGSRVAARVGFAGAFLLRRPFCQESTFGVGALPLASAPGHAMPHRTNGDWAQSVWLRRTTPSSIFSSVPARAGGIIKRMDEMRGTQSSEVGVLGTLPDRPHVADGSGFTVIHRGKRRACFGPRRDDSNTPKPTLLAPWEHGTAEVSPQSRCLASSSAASLRKSRKVILVSTMA
jgi:hypothetical protein